MNRILSLVTVLCLFSCSNNNAVSPYISIRSQSVDSSRFLIGLTDKINLFDMENLYITGALTLEGTRSFDSDALAHCLLGITTPSTSSSDEPSLQVSGSQVPNRGASNWLADYFGLPTTFQSTLFFKPRVTNFIMDFSIYVGLDEWVEGLYFTAHAPLVATRWNLNFTEDLHTTLPLQGYPAGYFAPSAIPASNLLTQSSEFLSDTDVPTLADGVTFEPLQFARFEQTRLHKTALAEIQFALGYNFISCPCYHLGLNFRVDAPTGNRPKGIFAFEPMVGNGKHWAVGAGFSGHYTFWESEDEESSFGFYADGNFTHLCRTHQTRTFDLKGKPNSRYMLAQRLGAPANPPTLFANAAPGTAIGSTVPVAQFNNAFAPVANLTTLKVNVSSPIQIDITGLFNYTACGISIDVGYNFWARSCERISIRNDQGPTRLESGTVWALKGDAYVYGFGAADAVSPAPASVALSASQSNATINSGTNTAASGNLNTAIDNLQYAMFSIADNADQLVAAPGNPGGPAFQQRTSNDPIFLSNNDIDINGARTKGLSHKFFAHLNYTWCECDDIVPFIGIGGKAEFGPRHAEPPCNPDNTICLTANSPFACPDCKPCQRCNLSEWGVWVKGGIFWS